MLIRAAVLVPASSAITWGKPDRSSVPDPSSAISVVGETGCDSLIDPASMRVVPVNAKLVPKVSLPAPCFTISPAPVTAPLNT